MMKKEIINSTVNICGNVLNVCILRLTTSHSWSNPLRKFYIQIVWYKVMANGPPTSISKSLKYDHFKILIFIV